MTDSNQEQSGESADAARNRWVNDAQAALDRTVEAMKSAWAATRESRMSALDSAKQAAQELGNVLDKGMAAARDRWSAEESDAGDSMEATDSANQDQPPPDVEPPGQTPNDDTP